VFLPPSLTSNWTTFRASLRSVCGDIFHMQFIPILALPPCSKSDSLPCRLCRLPSPGGSFRAFFLCAKSGSCLTLPVTCSPVLPSLSRLATPNFPLVRQGIPSRLIACPWLEFFLKSGFRHLAHVLEPRSLSACDTPLLRSYSPAVFFFFF